MNESYTVEDEYTHHMKNVMRLRVDDEFEMVDKSHRLFQCKIIEMDRHIEYEVTREKESDAELPVYVTIVCPLLKGEKFDWMIQKSTELGAHHFKIYDADRSIVKLDDKKRHKRLERFKKIVTEASEQSGRLRIPEVEFSGSLPSLDFDGEDHIFIAYEHHAGDGEMSLGAHMERVTPESSISFIFGPEGGLTEREVTAYEQFHPVSLGSRILRAETAPLYFLTAVGLSLE